VTDDLRASIVAAISRHCPDHYDHDWLAAADAVLALVRPPDEELTRDEAVSLADDLGQQLYRAEDRVAFVREMLASRTEPVTPATVLAWLDHQHCPRVESEQQQIERLTAERDRLAAELEHLRPPKQTVTNHTYEGTPAAGKPCQAEAFGETCGAPWEQHEMRPTARPLPIGEGS